MKSSTLFLGFGLLVLPLAVAGQQAPLTPELLKSFRFREIGPAVTGGRIHDVEALPQDPSTIYVAAASGGLWKTTNNGTTWTPLFDDQPVSTFGDVAIAPSNPDVIWAGTGEQNNRQSTSWGNGVYRSTDGGKTWTHLGLVETRHIGRIVVHPYDPDIAYVAALGNLWKPNPERGVFKTEDGGRSWLKVLYVDTLTGAVDLVMDPTDPNTLYAATYQRLRRTWGFNGGGPGSGIWKTTDGGRTWRKLARGVPEGDKGRIGLTISRTNPRVLNALIEHATESGTYRTEDGGETWVKVSDLNPRPMYYSHIFIDPTNERRVYVLATNAYKSEDGGRTFERLPTAPTYDVGVHSDFHALWIDPNRPKHFLLAGDGGLYETWDLGLTYRKINNFAIGQFYDVGVDFREPYFVYGGMQDNHSWMGPSATRRWEGIINDDWKQIGFGDGMYWQPDPTSHRYVYGNSQNGGYTRVDAETGDRLDLRPVAPAGEPDYRWDWVSPSLVSRHNPSVVYLGGNRLFISRDRGLNWDRTPDLTQQIDRDTLSLMGVRGSESMLSKNDGTASFGEITTIAESPLDPDVLWVGVDDGNIQVSRDGGKTWAEVSRNLPPAVRGAYVSRVLASAKSPSSAYVTLDAHQDGDFAPYVFYTADFGRTWVPKHGGLPTGSVKSIAEDPRNPDLLFLGTEHALYLSPDAGSTWVRFMPNLPTTLYQDLVIHPRDRDLVVATHGRSIWILDDISPLAEWSSSVAAAEAHVFSIRPATIFQYWKDTSYRSQEAYAGQNPPDGAIITYYLKSSHSAARLVVSNSRGDTVRVLAGPSGAGIHRINWDLRHEPPPVPSGFGGAEEPQVSLPRSVGPRGPFVAPGRYTVFLEAGRAKASATVLVRGDPAMPFLSPRDYEERESFLLSLISLQRRAAEAADRARGADLDPRMQDLLRRLRSLQRDLAALYGDLEGIAVQQGSLYPPTATHRERKERAQRELDAWLQELGRR